MTAAAAGPPAGRLPCGRSADDVLTQVGEGRDRDLDEHQTSCPHCRAALAEYARLWGPIATSAAAPVRAPGGLFDAVLARLGRTAGGWGQFDDGGGTVLVSARVVVAVAGHAAELVDGVRVALGAFAADGVRVRAGVAGSSVALDLTVVAEYGQDLPRLADRLRTRVAAAVEATTGLDTVGINVTVGDILPPRQPADRTP